MRTETRTIYTLDELRQHKPAAYARVQRRWVESCHAHGAPWAGEVHDSYEAVVEACGGSLNGRGPSADDYDDEGKLKDAAWLLENVLRHNGYVEDGAAHFPGLCKWTGYCADDDMIEAVYKSMADGRTITQALRDLDAVIERHNEDDIEQMEGEDSMLANWGDNEYDEDGDDA